MACIQSELASLAVFPTEVRAMQMAADQNQQQAEVGRSEHLDIVADFHGGDTLNETTEGHVRTDSEGEDMAVSGVAPGEVVSITNQVSHYWGCFQQLWEQLRGGGAGP
jgi:hypothetical protein